MGWFSPSSHNHRPAYSRASSSYSSSYYRRRPRDGYINRLVHKIKQLLRELYIYARRHPVKLFFMVIMPLISGGALAGFARQFGIRLPDVLNRTQAGRGFGGNSFGGSAFSSGSSGYYGSRGYGDSSDGGFGAGLLSSGNIGSLMSIAKMFM
ncbi:hypothetical protein K490DRAFT_34362 [Saccharata proteae CBS 121410]|uniref:Uncharacterized protein n=1 Tax=Saccharata proteae CBS 121410 TaxID=1314787 RepID=A0A9P4M223_9PEZI|nr:hypothetical protein K490DRAFT_34362 [Saccharata proteae CBS 121410]